MGDMKVVNLCGPTSKVEAKNLRHIRCPLPRFGGGAPKLAAFYNTKYNNKCSKSNKIHDGCRNILKQMKRLDVDEKGLFNILFRGEALPKEVGRLVPPRLVAAVASFGCDAGCAGTCRLPPMRPGQR